MFQLLKCLMKCFRVWRIYYWEVRYLVKEGTSWRRFLWHQALNVLFAAWLIRFVFIWTCVRLEWIDAYLRFDLLASFFRRVMLFDDWIVLAFASLFLFALLHNLFLYSTSESYIWLLIYQLVISNTDDLSRHFDRPKALITHHPIFALRQIHIQSDSLWRNNRWNGKSQNVNFISSIASFPFIATRTRVRLFLLLGFAEAQISAVLALFGILSLLVIINVVYRMYLLQTLTPFTMAVIVCDVLTLTYTGWSLFKLSILAFLSHMVLLYVFKATFYQVKAKMKQIVNELPTNLCEGTKILFGEHTRITRYIVDADSQFWAGGSLIMLLTNIPSNVYFVTFLHFRSIEASVQAVLYTILLLQSGAIVQALWSTAQVCSAAHSCQPVLSSLQSKLQRRHLCFKLKCERFYEQLLLKRPIAFSVGTFAPITKEGIFQFVFTYAGFYLYIVRLFNE